ncbi:hypothetical protein PoB_000760100 [Plakobranchus ocellatus]|uniref:Uncharacterized protein n=1 Tax=Plakobranchus ocellatus TaxID=259542 RepID=A0AAV3Y1I2_9GAST|nr:hypothetical protein PoB_000760100 [Plakobranchus ocellatus]
MLSLYNMSLSGCKWWNFNNYVIGSVTDTTVKRVWFLYIASTQQGDLRLSGPPPGQSAGGSSRTRVRRVPAYLRADSLATVPPTPQLRRRRETKQNKNKG